MQLIPLGGTKERWSDRRFRKVCGRRRLRTWSPVSRRPLLLPVPVEGHPMRVVKLKKMKRIGGVHFTRTG